MAKYLYPQGEFPDIGNPSSPFSEDAYKSPKKNKRERRRISSRNSSRSSGSGSVSRNISRKNAHNRSVRKELEGHDVGARSTGKTKKEVNLTSWWCKFKNKLSKESVQHLYEKLNFKKGDRMTETLKEKIKSIVQNEKLR